MKIKTYFKKASNQHTFAVCFLILLFKTGKNYNIVSKINDTSF